MKRKIIAAAVFTLAALIASSNAITINCTFGIVGWDDIVVNPYTCRVNTLNVTSRVTVTSVNGQHTPTRTHDHVTAIHIFAQTCHLLPRGFEKFFAHIEAIAVQNSKLKFISKSDLRAFPQLRSLSLFGNDLSALEFGLFKFTPRLEFVSVFANKLRHVGEDIFAGLGRLKKGFFTNCECVDFMATGSKGFEELSERLRGNCSSTIEMRHLHEVEVRSERVERNFDILSRKFQLKSRETNVLHFEVQKLTTATRNFTGNSCARNEETSLRLEVCEERLRQMSEDVDEIELICDFYDGRLCIVEDLMVMNEYTKLVGAKIEGREKRDAVKVTGTMSADMEKLNLDDLGIDFSKRLQNEEKDYEDHLTESLQNVTDKFGEIFFTTADTVEELWIVSHNVHFLPINIGKFFTNLKDLRVVKSNVKRINAKSMRNLEKLEVLKLARNEISSIDNEAFDELTRLRVLDLSMNHIESVCDEPVVQAEETSEIHEISECEETPKPTPAPLPQNLHHTTCTNFRVFASLTNLSELNLQGNKITYIDWKVLANNAQLEVVNLRGNKIAEIGSNFDARAIKTLDLRENVCVDAKFLEMSEAEIVKVFETKCSVGVMLKCVFDDDNGDYTCRAVDLTVDSENTFFTQLSGVHQPDMSQLDVTKVIVAGEKIKFLPMQLENLFPNVTEIKIESSKLTKVPKLSGFTSIEIVFNSIREIDSDVFGDSPEVTKIQLANNGIEKIPENLFAGLKMLTHLDLSNNLLKTISKKLIPTENALVEILLGNNRLTRIDSALVKTLTEVDVIDLSGNPCVDNKFDRAAGDAKKKIMEIYGEIEFQCKEE